MPQNLPQNLSWQVATFYKFVALTDCAARRDRLFDLCHSQQVKGTILLAPEGINATLAGTEAQIGAVLAHLQQDPRLSDLTCKFAWSKTRPFERLKVKVKREIVTFGDPAADPTQRVGTYVAPEAWNQVISDPEVTVIDTRNAYEVGMGSFRGAQNPDIERFRDFPAYAQRHLDPNRHKKVAMFCTGGIRCEKASAYLLNQGFEQVYHLRGGILKYLETVPKHESLWAGECFVFDERVAVQHSLKPGSYDLCYACGHPVSPADQASPDYEAEVSCPHCIGKLTPEERDRRVEKRRQRQLMKSASACAPESTRQRSAPGSHPPADPGESSG